MEHSEDARNASKEIVMSPIDDYLKNGSASRFSPQRVSDALKVAAKLGYLSKDLASLYQFHIDQTKPEWEAEQAKRGAAAAMEMAPKTSGTPSFQGGGMPQPPQASMMQPQQQADLMSMASPMQLEAIKAAAQMASKPAPQQAPQQQPPGGPPPNPSSGAAPPAGPAPNEAVAGTPPQVAPAPAAMMKVGSVNSGAGWGPGPAVTAQAKPRVLIPPPVWEQDRTQEEVGTALGQMEGAKAATILRQKNAAEWEQTQKVIANLKQQVPDFDKLPPLQRSEIIARAMGIQGSISNLSRPMNLPASEIFNDQLPEGAMDPEGRLIDRTKYGAYRQQQGVGNDGQPQIRFVTSSPRTTTHRYLTNAGPVLASIDRRGTVTKVQHEIGGAEIVDPALLEQVRQQVTKVRTVDEYGNEVTVFVPTETRGQKLLPNQQPGGPPPTSGGTPPAASPATTPGAPAPGGAQPPVASGSQPRTRIPVPAPRPAPLSSSTRDAATFAQTVMQHIPGIQSAINDLEKTGDLGVIASRWNDFRTGKIGAGDDRYTALRTAVQMLDTALVRVHARGGSNAMMEHFNALSNAGRMDAATLRSAVTELTKWVETYSKMGANRPGAVRMGGADPSKAHGEPPPAGLTPPPGNETEAQKIERLKKKYGGK
jgi:hypothetical protein